MTNSPAEPAKPRYRYSIGGLLVLLAVVGVFLGFYVNQDNYTSEFVLRFPNGNFENGELTSERFIKKVLQRPEAAKLKSVRNGSAANLLKNKLTAVSFMDSYGCRIRLTGNTYRHRTAEFDALLECVAKVCAESHDAVILTMPGRGPTHAGR